MKKVKLKMSKALLRIEGMHCSSCALNIDFDLEDLDGVETAKTNYAKQISEVEYDEKKVSLNQLLEQIQKTGYKAEII